MEKCWICWKITILRPTRAFIIYRSSSSIELKKFSSSFNKILQNLFISSIITLLYSFKIQKSRGTIFAYHLKRVLYANFERTGRMIIQSRNINVCCSIGKQPCYESLYNAFGHFASTISMAQTLLFHSSYSRATKFRDILRITKPVTLTMQRLGIIISTRAITWLSISFLLTVWPLG